MFFYVWGSGWNENGVYFSTPGWPFESPVNVRYVRFLKCIQFGQFVQLGSAHRRYNWSSSSMNNKWLHTAQGSTYKERDGQRMEIRQETRLRWHVASPHPSLLPITDVAYFGNTIRTSFWSVPLQRSAICWFKYLPCSLSSLGSSPVSSLACNTHNCLRLYCGEASVRTTCLPLLSFCIFFTLFTGVSVVNNAVSLNQLCSPTTVCVGVKWNCIGCYGGRSYVNSFYSPIYFGYSHNFFRILSLLLVHLINNIIPIMIDDV